MTDWTQYGGKEVVLGEIQKLAQLPPHWGWVEGMYEGGNDDLIALRFLYCHKYEPVSRELWKRVCKGADLVADIGSHSGVFTLDAYRSGCKMVFSAEPHPINFARLVLNLRYNKFPPGGAFYGGISDENKVGTLLVKQLYACHAAGRVDMQGNGWQLPINVRRLDTLLPEEAWPTLKAVKIDAENLTPNVLRGMGKILDHKPDLLIECTMTGMDEILKPLGYKFWTIWETGKIEEIDTLVPNDPNKEYNGTLQDNRNRFASVRDLPD